MPPTFDKVTKSWTSLPRDGLAGAILDLPERVRTFRMQIRALVAQTGGFLQASEVRPFSAAILVKMSSAFMPWSQEEFDLLEIHFTRALDCGVCTQNSREWSSLPFL